MSFAIVTISGNITRDAEVVNFKNKDTHGAKLGIAVNDGKEHTSFYDVLFSDPSAVKFLLEKGLKGSAITIVGDLVINTGNDGKTFVNVYGRSVVELFNRKPTTETTNGGRDNNPPTDLPKSVARDTRPSPTKPATAPSAKPAPAPTVEVADDDDFPF